MDHLIAPDEFTELFRQTAPRVHAYAVRRVGRDHADDLVSETYAIAWRRRNQMGVPVLPWLFVVARNLAANHYRAEQRRHRTWLAAVEDQWTTPSSPSAPEAVVLIRATAMLALEGCNDNDREALLLTAWDWLSIHEAAQVAGCSARTFTVRLSRARARFDRLYAEADGRASVRAVASDRDSSLATASSIPFSSLEELS